MTRSLADESGRLMLELHWALLEIDPARWRADAAARARAEMRRIQRRLAELTEKGEGSSLRPPLTALARVLATAPSEEASDGSLATRWTAFRQAMVPSYEAMRRALREQRIHVPSLRPSNLKRAVFHATSALTALATLYLMPAPAWTMAVGIPLALTAWTLEAIRRRHPDFNTRIMRFFAPLAHPHEYQRINSGTWYLTAIALLASAAAVLGPVPPAVGAAVLGFGDPAAALVGRRIGRVRLVHGRTLEGTLGFFAVAGAVGTLVVFPFAPHLPWVTALLLGAAGAFAGALAELFSLRLDDNLTVAVVATGAAALAALALGVPLGA
ncbi:MAG TPA: hypothetical protein RMH99_13745 [Sandaracinaceae bacterium LLY-WYZ-13_1]|nr:hypothetical protein [Sandaracinaceae bacterium LLY-WYZ-13_1]